MENIILPEGYESNDNDNTNLVDELEKSTNVAYTENGAISNRSSLDAVLDFLHLESQCDIILKVKFLICFTRHSFKIIFLR